MENTPAVKLKGVGDGFWVSLDPSLPEQILKDDLAKLFERLKHLAINARVVIDTGDGKQHPALVESLGQWLKDTFDVGGVTGPPEKRSVPVERIRQRDLSKSWTHHRSDALMLKGRVRSGQKIETRKHIIIMGDVNPGAELVAGGNIIVLGRLQGGVTAGAPNNDEAIIVALDFRPTHVQIGSYVATGMDESNPDQRPEFACVTPEGIVVQDYLKANPFGKIPWPEVI